MRAELNYHPNGHWRRGEVIRDSKWVALLKKERKLTSVRAAPKERGYWYREKTNTIELWYVPSPWKKSIRNKPAFSFKADRVDDYWITSQEMGFFGTVLERSR